MDSHEPGASDSDLSEDEISRGKTPSTQELQRRPSERHAFLFRHNLSPSAPDLREFHPLPSQIPFLLDVFLESVNSLIRVVHVPTVTKLVRDLRGSDMTSMTPANEALMFSIYYAAVTAMEEDDVSSVGIECLSCQMVSEPELTTSTFADHRRLWLYQSRSQPQVPSRPRACTC